MSHLRKLLVPQKEGPVWARQVGTGFHPSSCEHRGSSVGVWEHWAPLGTGPPSDISSGLIQKGQFPGGRPEAKISNGAMSDQLIVAPWGAM